MAQEETKTTPIIIRKSAALLMARLVLLEAVFILSYLLLTLPLNFIDVALTVGSLYILFILVFVILAVVKTFFLVVIILSWVNEYYMVMPGVLIHRRGILRTEETSFALSNVEFQSVRQSVWGRIFDFGTIEVYNPLVKETCNLHSVPSPRLQLEVVKEHTIQHEERGRIMPMPSPEQRAHRMSA